MFLSTFSYGIIIESKPISIKPTFLKALEFNIVPIPRDTLPTIDGEPGLEDFCYDIICYKNYESSQLFIRSNFSKEDVEIIVFERARGVAFIGVIDLRAGQEFSIDTPWGQGVYTIIFRVSDDIILSGDFIIL